MRLSYSKYRTYLNCPRLYYNQVNYISAPERESMYFALYGKAIERFFNQYANEYSKKDTPLTEPQIRTMLQRGWQYLLRNNYVNWDDPWVRETADQIFERVYEDTLKNIAAFNFWKDCRPEVSFQVVLKKSGDLLTCRMDFIRAMPDGGVEIIDGKGTNKMDKTVDIDQLYFYALMYLLTHRKLPNKIGFLYYRFQTLKYLDFDLDTIMKFKDKLALVKKGIKEDETFETRVALSKHCKWCVYKHECGGYIEKKAANAAKRPTIINIEPEGGVVDLGLSGGSHG